MKLKICLILFLTISYSITYSQTKMNTSKDFSMFPKAPKGQNQFVIFLDPKDTEDNYKIQLFGSKKATVDDCNTHFLMGSFADKELQGWGYDYHVFTSNGAIGSTKRACLKYNTVEAIVQSQGSELIRYNSKLPIVVYAPEGIQISYKIWSATSKELNAVKQ